MHSVAPSQLWQQLFEALYHVMLHAFKPDGIDGPLHTWLTCFLTERKMPAVLEGSSEPASVESGVPRGTVLGPFLFLCNITNHLGAVSSQVRLFADDCLLYQEINTYTDHHTQQEDLKQL